MAEITAILVKTLREKTGAGMMDCKKALSETDGNLEDAVDWLRKNGFASAQKKSGRVAAEGLVAAISQNNQGALVEINAETDFVARNEQFQDFVLQSVTRALEFDDVAKILASDYPNKGRSFQDQLTDNIATIGENMNFRRAHKLQIAKGAVAHYIHAPLRDNMGKIGVLVGLESDGDAKKLQEMAYKIAMHVAAARPQFLTIESVDAAVLERERNILAEQARASGKPEEIINKMVEGRLRKYYEESVLNEQIFVIDNENKIGKLLENFGTELGTPVKLAGFERFELGEGIEKQESDFAQEVADAVKG